MRNKSKWLYLSILSLVMVVFGLLHQKLSSGGEWFNWKQFWHHEPLIAIAFVAWITLLVVYLAECRQEAKR